MLAHEARVGMKVRFGRENGEKTLGEIVKVNPTKAKVKTLESRGSGRGSADGSVWTVPYSLMTPEDLRDTFLDEFNRTPPLPADVMQEIVKAQVRKLADVLVSVYIPHGDACIMEAILDCYTRLSPEFLTADGERPMNEVRRLKHSLESRLDHLFKALGRPVSETAAYQWDEERKKKEAV